jgi:hypothetical protein
MTLTPSNKIGRLSAFKGTHIVTQLKKGIIYELRIYPSMPGRLPVLLARFQNHTLRILEKHGIHKAGFWTTLIGQSNQRLTYLLAWDNMAERKERWSTFLADPEWIAIGTETEKHGPLVQNISNELLAPTAFFSLKSAVGQATELEPVASGLQTPSQRHT